MDATHAPGTATREWCGTSIPPELTTLPHPTKLRIVLPLDGFRRGFRVLWCAIIALTSIPLCVLNPPLGVLMLAVVVYLWTRPARTVITFRPGRRWVTVVSPVHGSGSAFSSVDLEIQHAPDGWHAKLNYREFALGETDPEPERDRAVDRLLPFANTLRREMGDPPLPTP